jgi:protein CpxP
VAAALFTAIGIAPSGASAFMGEDGPPMKGQHFARMATELGLSAQQKTDIKAIFQKNRAQFQPLLKQMVAERHALRTLIQADVIDEAAIRAQSARVAAIQADLAVQRAHMGQEVRKLLTPEQIQKLKEFQTRMDEHRGKAGSRPMKRIEPDN